MCKYGVFPIKHPQVYYKDDIPDQVQGLLKCKILPPAQLFHPLLPTRVNGKLVFTLCRTCAEKGTKNDGAIADCTHADEERALVEHSEDYLRFLDHTSRLVERAIEEVDIFTDYSGQNAEDLDR